MSHLINIPSVVNKYIVYELCIETTKILNNMQDKLKNITWNNGEANIDTEYSKLACDCCVISWKHIKTKYPEYNNIDIICKIPDINISFTYAQNVISQHKIELKSSKSKKMHGSTIKNLDINQMLIYCLRPSTEFEYYVVRCSQYFNVMCESDVELFQDRTPRPIINFEKMNDVNNVAPFIIKNKNDWVEYYATCALNRIKNTTICQKSWQDDMVMLMEKKVIDNYIKNTSEQQFQIDKKQFET
jgi:hypothetical protein